MYRTKNSSKIFSSVFPSGFRLRLCDSDSLQVTRTVQCIWSDLHNTVICEVLIFLCYRCMYYLFQAFRHRSRVSHAIDITASSIFFPENFQLSRKIQVFIYIFAFVWIYPVVLYDGRVYQTKRYFLVDNTRFDHLAGLLCFVCFLKDIL